MRNTVAKLTLDLDPNILNLVHSGLAPPRSQTFIRYLRASKARQFLFPDATRLKELRVGRDGKERRFS